jgi:ERCC4-related helicase
VVDIWKSGEKAVVFCHYIATGRTLRQRISEAVNEEICKIASKKLQCDPLQAQSELDRISKRFFDEDSPVRQACDEEAMKIIKSYPELEKYNKNLLNIVRRNARTSSFLVRFFPLQLGRLTKDHMLEAMDSRDSSNLTFRDLLEHFFEFLVNRCGKEDQRRYIEAVSRIQTGSYSGSDINTSYMPDTEETDQRENLNPTVRLVNGATKSEQRQRLMLTFNTPFYPEILVASSVMAEGVDLHLNCRYMIHHDLCWNPTTLEQRTGRIDRIGAKVERSGESIHVYLPYVAETQDEKMYRVVMDRERWFNVVMGEDYKTDLKTTDKISERVPLPKSVAEHLSFRLEI